MHRLPPAARRILKQLDLLEETKAIPTNQQIQQQKTLERNRIGK
jgi:hypothetical protein